MRALGTWQETLLSKPKPSFTTIYWKDRCWNCKKTGCSKYKCSQPIDEAECSKNQIAWRKGNNKLPNDGKRRKKPTPLEWRPPSPEEFGKRIIYGKPYTWNNNGSWKIDSTPDSGLTPGDSAAAATIAVATTAAITATGQKNAGAALHAATAAAKAIKFATTISNDASINDDGTAVTEMTQDQAIEIQRIQANLDNYKTTIDGMSNNISKFRHKE